MRLSDSSLVLATRLGGLGGAINAWMFYATQPTVAFHVSLAVVSGVVGSLSWWLASSWWTSVAHGSVWGALVGRGVWAGQRRSTPMAG